MAAVGALVALVVVAFWLDAAAGGGNEPATTGARAEETRVIEATEAPTALTSSTPSPTTARGDLTAEPTTPPLPAESPTEIPTATAEPSVLETPAVAAVAPTEVVATPQPAIETPGLAPLIQAPVAGEVLFAGSWRIIDTVTGGTGTGQTFTFDVLLTQTGPVLQGGSSELSIVGLVDGNSATATFTQPSGITGAFSRTVGEDGNAIGTFTSSVPNSGTSQLIRLD